MLHEIKNVKQERDVGRRRWFESEDLELIVWFDHGDRVTGFQLCYDFGRGEHALTWREGLGFAHSIVDQGDATPLKNEAPVLQPDSHMPWSEIAGLFDRRSAALEPTLRQMIHEKLAERAGTKTDR